MIPAGTYSDELILSGSCNIIGELHGVNPNKKPYDVIGQDDLLSSAWTLNADWANSEKLTTFNACIRVSDDADDFIITFDGIKMGVGASFVEDQNRYSSNTLVFKNIYMENAGGGTNKAGTANGYLFQFNKTYGVSKDFLNVYLLDSRIDNTGAFHVFGPYAEKLVVDGLYLGKIDGKSFMNNMASRDIADPYVSVTNSYFNQCGLDQTGYNLITLKDTNGLEAKTNIVYNFDNNVFIEAFPAGTPMLNVTFTGKNMKYYFTNNIVYDAKDMHDVFSGDDTYAGTCAQEDVSDMIIFKGNRLVRWRRLPVTTGVGAGTSIDFSGNYFAITTSDTLGLTPADADVDSLRASSTNAVELEAARRRKVDYTYLDWDMTIRSDCTELNKTAYSFTKGMFGTGTNKVEEVDGVHMPVYRDTNVPADCEVYELPFTTSEYADVKIYTSPSCIDTFLVDELRLTSTTNKFYVKVNSVDGTTAQTFAIYIDRLENTEASLVAFDDFVIDDKAETVTGHVDRRYIYLKSTVEVSNGATFVMYDDAACTIPTSESDVSFRPTASAPVVKYIKVTSEDGAVEKVYTFTLNLYSDVSEIDVAGISSVAGMTRVDASNFKMAVSPAADVFAFAPVAYVGSILDVYNGNELLVPDANGVYTVVNSGDFNQTLRVVATAGDGVTVKEYRLTVVKEDSSECDLLAVESAVKTSSGFAMLFNHSQSMVLNATVTPGASYEVYADYACTKLYDGNLVILDDNSNTFAYVKVTSEDGKHTAIHKVTLLAQPGNRASTPVVTATVGNKTYTSVTTGANELTIYLPAGTTSAVLSAKYSVKEPTSTIKLFADPNCSTELNAALSLDTKITKAYLSTTAGSYKVDRIVPESSDNEASTTLTVSGVLPLSEWVINVVADQDTVVYSDANDIAEWVAPYVDYLNNNNYKIFAGDQNKKFNASLNITRNEIAIIATRVMG
ncbi:MAG: hypothetical protein IJ333_08375, partial [Clostridia bacterium]|nr:hypothetical protein [Clostridia bacterium]